MDTDRQENKWLSPRVLRARGNDDSNGGQQTPSSHRQQSKGGSNTFYNSAQHSYPHEPGNRNGEGGAGSSNYNRHVNQQHRGDGGRAHFPKDRTGSRNSNNHNHNSSGGAGGRQVPVRRSLQNSSDGEPALPPPRSAQLLGATRQRGCALPSAAHQSTPMDLRSAGGGGGGGGNMPRRPGGTGKHQQHNEHHQRPQQVQRGSGPENNNAAGAAARESGRRCRGNVNNVSVGGAHAINSAGPATPLSPYVLHLSRQQPLPQQQHQQQQKLLGVAVPGPFGRLSTTINPVHASGQTFTSYGAAAAPATTTVTMSAADIINSHANASGNAALGNGGVGMVPPPPPPQYSAAMSMGVGAAVAAPSQQRHANLQNSGLFGLRPLHPPGTGAASAGREAASPDLITRAGVTAILRQMGAVDPDTSSTYNSLSSIPLTQSHDMGYNTMDGIKFMIPLVEDDDDEGETSPGVGLPGMMDSSKGVMLNPWQPAVATGATSTLDFSTSFGAQPPFAQGGLDSLSKAFSTATHTDPSVGMATTPRNTSHVTRSSLFSQLTGEAPEPTPSATPDAPGGFGGSLRSLEAGAHHNPSSHHHRNSELRNLFSELIQPKSRVLMEGAMSPTSASELGTAAAGTGGLQDDWAVEPSGAAAGRSGTTAPPIPAQREPMGGLYTPALPEGVSGDSAAAAPQNGSSAWKQVVLAPLSQLQIHQQPPQAATATTTTSGLTAAAALASKPAVVPATAFIPESSGSVSSEVEPEPPQQPASNEVTAAVASKHHQSHTTGPARPSRPSLEAPEVTQQSFVCVFRETPQSMRRREKMLDKRRQSTSLSRSKAWPPHTDADVEKLLRQHNALKLLRHLTIIHYSQQHLNGVQDLFDTWARNGIPAPDIGFGAYYFYVKEKSEKLLCMKHNGRGATPGHGYGKCDFESRRPNSTCRYEHVCLCCRSRDHGWFEEGKCEGYQQLLAEVEALGVSEEDVGVMLNAMDIRGKASAWAQ